MLVIAHERKPRYIISVMQAFDYRVYGVRVVRAYYIVIFICFDRGSGKVVKADGLA